MGRLDIWEKMLLVLTAIGAGLVVVALALFALTGSGFVPDLLRGTAGAMLGMLTVQLLTRSPRRGRRAAALLLLASAVGSLAFLLKEVVLMSATTEGERGGIGFVISFLSWTAGASLARLLGVNPLGPRGSQTSRRRS